MKPKSIVRILTLLTVLGIATVFGFQANSQTQRRTFSEMTEFKPITSDIPEKYTGPQSVKALMDAFDAEYNRRHSKTTVKLSRKAGGAEIVNYVSQVTTTEIDARYPRAAWLQLLLDRGIIIEKFYKYASYLSKRHTLAFLEDNPNLRKAVISSIPPTDDWATYKTAYIDKLAAKQIEHHKKQAERAKAQIERRKKQLERAKEQSNSQQLKHIQAQLERAKKELEDARKQLKRAQEVLERAKKQTPQPQGPNQNMKERSPYPPL